MLVGTREAAGPVSAERFSAQWRDARVADRLREAGLEDPSQLGALFIADAPALRELVAEAPPLDDDHPYRISPRVRVPYDVAPFVRLLQIKAPLARFYASDLVRRLWPEAMREATRAAFYAQDAMNAAAFGAHDPAGSGLADLDRLLSETTLRAPVLWTLGTSVAEVRLARPPWRAGKTRRRPRRSSPWTRSHGRDYAEADRRFGLAEPHAAHAARIRMWRVLALGLGGDKDAAARLLEAAPGLAGSRASDEASWSWLARRLALKSRRAEGVGPRAPQPGIRASGARRVCLSDGQCPACGFPSVL